LGGASTREREQVRHGGSGCVPDSMASDKKYMQSPVLVDGIQIDIGKLYGEE
jgi:hypothetical protein